DADHVRIHPDLTIPGPDSGRAIGMEHQARGPIHEWPRGVTIVEVAAVTGPVETEPTIENSNHSVLLSGSQRRLSKPGPTGVLKTWVKLPANQVGINPHHTNQERGVLAVRANVSDPDRWPVMHRHHGFPLAFAR